jgi:hypothetical protein
MCQQATVNGCSQVINGQTVTPDPWTVTIGYMNPVGVISGLTSAKGLIILHGGDGGTMPESNSLADAYFRAGYEIVQVVWDNAWEYAYANMTGKTGNIQVAACRPATVFNWVYNNFFLNAPNFLNTAGMCALGDSAGSAAIAYSLAYYGADSYLDHVELLSGPVLSDLRAGCGVGTGFGTNDPVTVCSSGSACQLGGAGPGHSRLTSFQERRRRSTTGRTSQPAAPETLQQAIPPTPIGLGRAFWISPRFRMGPRPNSLTPTPLCPRGSVVASWITLGSTALPLVTTIPTTVQTTPALRAGSTIKLSPPEPRALTSTP